MYIYLCLPLEGDVKGLSSSQSKISLYRFKQALDNKLPSKFHSNHLSNLVKTHDLFNERPSYLYLDVLYIKQILEYLKI